MTTLGRPGFPGVARTALSGTPLWTVTSLFGLTSWKRSASSWSALDTVMILWHHAAANFSIGNAICRLNHGTPGENGHP
jgi:hypothetical protein